MARPVVHFEIGCEDLTKTIDFYKEVFSWNIIPEGISAKIDTGAGKGIPGHITALGHEPGKYINIYIETDDIAADLSRIETGGGQILVGPIQLPDGRSFAWFQDIAGNTVGLITPEKKE